jgi:hypothetical protein
MAIVFIKPALKQNYFKYEMLSIIIYFMWGALIGLIVDHNNSDLRAWWSLGLLVLLLYSIVLSFLFASICWMFSFHHQIYTALCSGINLFVLSTISFYRYSSIGSFKNIDTLYIFTIIFLLAHFFIIFFIQIRKTLSIKIITLIE